MMVLRNIFKENVRAVSPVADLHKKIGKDQLGKYSEGLAILDLGADQLGEFIAPHANRKCREILHSRPIPVSYGGRTGTVRQTTESRRVHQRS